MKRRHSNSLPYDAEIEYLESTGVQYINTGIIQTTLNYELTLVMQWTGATLSQFETFIGYMATSSSLPRSGFHKYSSHWMYGTNTTNSRAISDRNKHKIFLTANSSTSKESLYIDDTLDITTTAYNTGLPTNIIPFFLGARNEVANNVTTVRNYASARFYSLNYKLFNDADHTQLLSEWDLIPVRIGQVGYMYDRVSGRLFDNAGTGSFILGNDII